MDLIDALATGEFERLIGTPEGDWLDFKTSPYQLDTPQGKWELAKDAAAFANKGGGYIVIGVEAARQINAVAETAVQIRRVNKSVVNPDRYRGVLDSWVYPPLRNVQLRWFPPEGTEATGIFVVEVPAQDDQDKYFVVRKMVDDAGAESGAVGIPVRDGDRVTWLPAERIHHLIHAGRRLAPPRPAAPPHARIDLERRAEERIQHLERLGDEWGELPIYVLQAFPPPNGQLSDLYEPEGLLGTLSVPRGLRSSGFNWRTGVEPEVIEGTLLYRRLERALWLDPDGLLTAATLVTRDSLGWAINDRRPPAAPLRVNAIVLVEMTLEFFRLVHNELKPRAGEGQWSFLIRCKRFQQGRVVLSPGWRERGLGLEEPRPASSDDWTRRLNSEDSPQRDAFLALSRIYALWGLGESAIPFTTEQGQISEAAILAP